MASWSRGRVLVRPPALAVRLSPLPLAFALVAFASLLSGPVSIPRLEVVRILLKGVGISTAGAGWPAVDGTIIWQIRLPEVVAAALVGIALAVAGAIFQAVLRNPLADPYVVGTSAGAQLGVTCSLLLPWQIGVAGFGTLQIFAFVGALATVLLVYALARSRGRAPVVTLLLAGFVTSSFLISLTSLLMQLGGKLDQVTRWTLGGINLSTPTQLLFAGPMIVLLSLAGIALAAHLDILLLGEDAAVALGVRLESLRLTAVVIASLLTALAVSLAGVVAFVGLVVPHAMRLVYGPRHRILIPTSALAGGTFLMLADLISRVAFPPTPLPLGVVTAVVGAPFFLHLLRRYRREYAI